MSATEISVVVPVYNGERDITACLASVGRSVARLSDADRQRVEVIVCDNWSTDRTPELAQTATFECRSTFVRPPSHEPNRTRNWRAGLAQASGTWMMMLHADDLMAPGALARLLAAATGPDSFRADLIVGRHRMFADPMEPSALHPRLAVPSVISGPQMVREVLPYHCPFVPFVLMRRGAYEAVQGLDERWELVQDWELWLRICRNGDVLAVCAEVGWWRIHGASAAYRRINAAEHVALSEALEDLAPELTHATRDRAKRLARAKAALQLAGDPDVGTSQGQLGKLPAVAAARRTLRNVHREVALRQLRMRMAGARRVTRAGICTLR